MGKGIREIEHDFFVRLRTEIHQAGKFVYRDGVVDEETWKSAPVKMLFLLKDPVNPNCHEDKSLLSFLRDGAIHKRDRTWKNIARWVYSALHCNENLSYSKDVEKMGSDLKKRKHYLRYIVAVNLKKHPGKSTIPPARLIKAFQEYYKKWLPEQLGFYKDTDVIVCCGRGVRDCLVSVFEPTFGIPYSHKGWKNYHYEDVKVPYYQLPDGPMIIDYWHPSDWAHMSDRMKNNIFKSMIRDLVQNN